MKFGPVPASEAEGALLAHSQTVAHGRIAKGTRLSKDDVAALSRAGIEEVVAARLDDEDLTEDEAAALIGAALKTSHLTASEAATGRVNLFADAPGLLLPHRETIDRVNAVDPAITLATLAEFAPVARGRMVATVKIIPLAVAGSSVAAAIAILNETVAMRLAPFQARRVALIQTTLAGTQPKMLDKTRRVSDARLASAGSRIVSEMRCPHDTLALAASLSEAAEADLVLVFGASAVIDADDVVPAAIRKAGGTVDHLGMPVDPGNLLLIGRLDGRPVLGAPGCARSPKENGFDWVLDRLLAGLEVSSEAIRKMGVGGLLMEIASRPRPREAEEGDARPEEPSVEIIVLAAGRSSRMGGPNKLLATFDGQPLIRRSVETALAAKNAEGVRVVVGHMRDEIVAALAGLDVEIVDNPDFAAGLSTSLKAGFLASHDADGVLVMLADQPLLSAPDLDRLIAAFTGEGKGAIVAAADRGERRNPVILSTAFAAAIAALSGDVGAARIIAAHPEALIEVEIGAAASVDVDTPDALHAAGGRLQIESTKGA
ncbi:molybdopterin-binding/glycosyltransferase family 2 protein [Jiella sp. MQZ9-1]|uniref:Molybdopterin-binding/glycosyltransferase family 2 protein n=1 Tax=Jiella flava TaxID=2816857 RepID=A0A939FWE8_9HYPH|nr:molybdopterin-binding/glycosyltransferase family 2 protein [Jiella flava]MBO0662715.1 molybdopterin-binding/glycosyltransferase family 2 protein [Jiella flava]MCD2471137.1 molybdopterin-binding/glycosyltransferase family 2 protein [Jiella flava]